MPKFEYHVTAQKATTIDDMPEHGFAEVLSVADPFSYWKPGDLLFKSPSGEIVNMRKPCLTRTASNASNFLINVRILKEGERVTITV